jgi:hypothetical protein
MNRVFTLEFWEDDGWYVGRLAEVLIKSLPLAEYIQANIADAYQLLIQDDSTVSACSRARL